VKSLGKIKRGDTFSFTAELKDNATGAALTDAANNLKCQGRHYLSNELIVELEITENAPGTYFFAAGSTDEWKAMKILFDVEYTDGEIVSSSETFSVEVEADITRG
jgi:hypothetical protein